MSKRLASKLSGTEAAATAKYIPMSPQKVRLVADLVRGKKATEALTILRFTPKAAAEPVSKTIASALANAAENKQMNAEDLYVTNIFVDGAPTRTWRRFAARGRFRPLIRRSCHISVVVGEKEE
jgi:large subunit ribosomal protein L22